MAPQIIIKKILFKIYLDYPFPMGYRICYSTLKNLMQQKNGYIPNNSYEQIIGLRFTSNSLKLKNNSSEFINFKYRDWKRSKS